MGLGSPVGRVGIPLGSTELGVGGLSPPPDAGLTANEQVVVDGQYKLQAGSHVTILHGKAAEEAAAQNAQQNLIP